MRLRLTCLFFPVPIYDISGNWLANQVAITFSTATETGTGVWTDGGGPPFTIAKSSILNVYNVNFPDDNTYQATVVDADTITWSNGGVWTRTPGKAKHVCGCKKR